MITNSSLVAIRAALRVSLLHFLLTNKDQYTLVSIHLLFGTNSFKVVNTYLALILHFLTYPASLWFPWVIIAAAVPVRFPLSSFPLRVY
jgi:hypothetical protein